MKNQVLPTEFIKIIPVLPSSNIERDIQWYLDQTGFSLLWTDSGYAILRREGLTIHLQWHADTDDDPLLGGSVIRIFVINIQPLHDEFVQRGTVKENSLKRNTPWNTHEFGFYDLNHNAIFVVEDAQS